MDEWKVHFLGKLEGFEEEEIEVDAFGMINETSEDHGRRKKCL